jgi:hypothetical protein
MLMRQLDDDSPTRDAQSLAGNQTYGNSIKSCGSESNTTVLNQCQDTKHRRKRKHKIYHPAHVNNGSGPNATDTDNTRTSPTEERIVGDSPVEAPSRSDEHSAPRPVRSQHYSNRSSRRSHHRPHCSHQTPEELNIQTTSPHSPLKSCQSMDSLPSPDSGFPRSDTVLEPGDGGTDEESDSDIQSCSETTVLKGRPSKSSSIPLKNLNTMTIIENKTYDIRDWIRR